MLFIIVLALLILLFTPFIFMLFNMYVLFDVLWQLVFLSSVPFAQLTAQLITHLSINNNDYMQYTLNTVNHNILDFWVSL